MTEESNLIKLTALLTKSNMLLLKSYDARQYALKSLMKPATEPYVPMAASTREWLIEKTQKELTEIELAICQSEKFLFPPACDTQELEKKVTELTLQQSDVLSFLESNPAVLNKLLHHMEKQNDKLAPTKV